MKDLNPKNDFNSTTTLKNSTIPSSQDVLISDCYLQINQSEMTLPYMKFNKSLNEIPRSDYEILKQLMNRTETTIYINNSPNVNNSDLI